MNKKKKILFVVSNINKLEDTPCGICVEEFAIPYLIFLDNNFSVTTCSPNGGKAFISPSELHSIKKEWAFVHDVLSRTESLENIDTDLFDALYFPGGQAALCDLPKNEKVSNIVKIFYRENKPIGALSHGIAALLYVVADNGEPLLKDKEVCAFSKQEEEEQFKSRSLPFYLEDKLKEQGAILKYPTGEELLVVNCNNIISGQNKKASKDLAEEIIRIFNS